MALVTMNDVELNRLKIIQDLLERRIRPKAAAAVLGLTNRHLRRLRRRYVERGAAGLSSGRRGKPSNRQLPSNLRDEVLAIIKERYHDFGPTLAREKLDELHGMRLGTETLRRWMKAEGLWDDRKTKKKRVYQPRYRRECLGELVQIDGSEHWWFEDRGPQCSLLVYIDDATSRLMQLKFVETESAFAYFAATQEYLQQHGKPVAFYSDKHSIFRVAKKERAIEGSGMTQFGRALHELNIDILCANTPQAKGRVERANRTLQDRLVKELRLHNICDMEAANLFLPAFVADYNARFGKEPRNAKDLHRPLTSDDRLDQAFAWREERTVSHNLTIQYDRVLFLLEQSDVTRGLARKRVMVSDYPDGRLIITYNGLPLPYRIFDKLRQVDQGAITDNKHLSAALSHIKAKQQTAPPFKRSQCAPRRTSQQNHLFDGTEGRPVMPPATQAEITRATEPALLAGRQLPRHGYKPRITEPGKVIRPSAHSPADRPVYADGPIPKVHADFRFFNKYVVRKCQKKAAAKTRWKKPRAELLVQNITPAMEVEPLATYKRAA